MVYVDNMRAPHKGYIMCHMIADSTEELLAMVDLIGVKREYIQDAGTYREHFDIALSKKKLALKNGAKLITTRELGDILRAKKGGTV